MAMSIYVLRLFGFPIKFGKRPLPTVSRVYTSLIYTQTTYIYSDHQTINSGFFNSLALFYITI